MKAVLIKGLEMPNPKGFIDVRIQGDGEALLVCGMGECGTLECEQVEIHEEGKA